MWPILAPQDMVNGCMTQAKKTSKSPVAPSAIGVHGTNLDDLLFCHFMASRIFAKQVRCPTFLFLVVVVIGLCAEEQMRRVHAPRIVASVEHIQAIGNCAFLKHPSHAVSTDYRQSFNGIKVAVSGATSSYCTSPQLAFSGEFVDVAVKPFTNRGTCGMHASDTTQLAA